MEFLEAAGFIHFWGYTPAIDFLSYNKEQFNTLPELNVLLSGCSDIRHILKTFSTRLNNPNKQKINVCLHIILLRFILMKMNVNYSVVFYFSLPFLMKQNLPLESVWNCSLIFILIVLLGKNHRLILIT